ncbi:MAG: hypothetical protein KDA16_04425 [Phycisphaerales bacterium]|nr:hypothetical protein [Phycisphaerales bacterium]
MRSRKFHLAAALATLAVLAQIALGGLGGKFCIRMTPVPPSQGCTTGCCEHEQWKESVVALAADRGDDLPGDSGCCVELDDSAVLLAGADLLDLRCVGGMVLPAPASMRKRLDSCRPAIAVSAGEAAHPPPALVLIRATVLLI